MDCALYYINEANKCLDSVKELSIYQSVFEATEGDDYFIALEDENNNNIEKGTSFIQKAIDAVKALITSIKDAISNFLQWLKLKPDEKQAYDEFAKNCREHPEFAKQKVTVKDWKVIDGEYNKVVGEMEKEIRRLKNGEQEANQSKIDEMKNGMKKVAHLAGTAVVTINADQLLTRAKYSEQKAMELEDRINYDLGFTMSLERELGHKETKKYIRKVRALNSRITLVRYLAGARRQMTDIHKQAAREERALIYAKNKSLAKVMIKHGGEVGITKRDIANVIGQAKNNISQDYRVLRNKKRRMRLRDKELRNFDKYEKNRQKRIDQINRNQKFSDKQIEDERITIQKKNRRHF